MNIYKPVILAAALLAFNLCPLQADILDSSDPYVAAQRELRAHGAQIQAAFDAALVAIDNQPFVEAEVAPLFLEALTAYLKAQLLADAAATGQTLQPEAAAAAAAVQAAKLRDQLAAAGQLTQKYQEFFTAVKKAKKDFLAQERSRVETALNAQRKALDNKQENGDLGRVATIILAWRGKAAMTEVGLDRQFVKAFTDISIGDLLFYGPQGGPGSTLSVALRDLENFFAKTVLPSLTSPGEIKVGPARIETPPPAALLLLGPAATLVPANNPALRIDPSKPLGGEGSFVRKNLGIKW